MRAVRLASFVLFVVLGIGSQTLAQTSPSNTTGSGAVKWTFDVGSAEGSPVETTDGTVFVVGGLGYGSILYALRPSGALKWKHQFSNNAMFAKGADGEVYVASGTHLYAFAPDGSIRWRSDWHYPLEDPPAVAPDGTVYVRGACCFYALDGGGRAKWSVPTVNSTTGLVTGKHGTLFTNHDQDLLAYNPDGSLRWQHRLAGQVAWLGLGKDGTPYVAVDGAGGGVSIRDVYGLNPDGSIRQDYAIRQGQVSDVTFTSRPAIGPDATIYIGGDGGFTSGSSTSYYVYAIVPGGTIRWRFRTEYSVSAPPAIAPDGRVYAMDAYNVYALNPAGKLIWRYPFSAGAGADTNPSGPVLAGADTLYVHDANSTLYALSLSGVARYLLERQKSAQARAKAPATSGKQASQSPTASAAVMAERQKYINQARWIPKDSDWLQIGYVSLLADPKIRTDVYVDPKFVIHDSIDNLYMYWDKEVNTVGWSIRSMWLLDCQNGYGGQVEEIPSSTKWTDYRLAVLQATGKSFDKFASEPRAELAKLEQRMAALGQLSEIGAHGPVALEAQYICAGRLP